VIRSPMETVSAIPAPPARPDDAHKGTFGTVIVVGGSPIMIGAPAMTATSAFRSGAGLVKIMTHTAVLPHCLGIEPSATGLHRDMDLGLLSASTEKLVLAIGPGMGAGPDECALLESLLRLEQPCVLDADGLNNLASLGAAAGKCHAPLVLTPHPGEYRRLAHASGLSLDPTDPDQRSDAAAALADRYGAVVVLKGRRTVVCAGDQSYTNTTGNVALATAGTGDVLTGVIAAFMAQGMQAFDAAVLGVYLHGLAADVWAQRHGKSGLLARELADLLPEVIEKHRRQH
jgi:ADP-dependent NAD(P)H-hydrate dehydratase